MSPNLLILVLHQERLTQSEIAGSDIFQEKMMKNLSQLKQPQSWPFSLFSENKRLYQF